MERAAKALSIRSELRDTVKLASPIVLNQVGHMSMAMVDTLIAGKISTVALAGLGLAANFYWTLTSVCVGVLLSLDTYFSQSAGARDEAALSRYFRQAFWSAGFVGLGALTCILGGHFIYLAFAAPGPSRTAFANYIETIVWALPALFVYFVLQRYWQARQRVLPFTVIILSANLLNLVLCLAFGLGWWGFPRLEVHGIALATTVCRYAMLFAAIGFTCWQLRPVSWRWPRVDWEVQRRVFRLGLPAGAHTALEVGAFGVATFIVSTLGPVALAAHHVCLMMASFTFMFPLGFAAAAAVRVGSFIGAGQPQRARIAGWLCIAVAVMVMSVFAVGYLTLPRTLLGWFSNDPAVISLGVKILVLAALFQIADGIQVSSTGALRGLGNTRSPMIANLIGHYPIGLVLGLVLCFGFGWGAVGLWTGLALGLVVVALIVLTVWRVQTRNPERLQAQDR